MLQAEEIGDYRWATPAEADRAAERPGGAPGGAGPPGRLARTVYLEDGRPVMGVTG